MPRAKSAKVAKVESERLNVVNLKPYNWLLFFCVFVMPAKADDLSRKSEFASVQDFVNAMKSFQPAQSKSDFSALFTVPEPGQPGAPGTGRPVTAAAIPSCAVLWANDSRALVLVTANPPTDEVTHSAVGLLILLIKKEGHWSITDLQRFTALGKYADITAELTSFPNSTGPRLGSEGMEPIITVKKSDGGRGYSSNISASYSAANGKLKRLDLQ